MYIVFKSRLQPKSTKGNQNGEDYCGQLKSGGLLWSMEVEKIVMGD